MLTQEEARAIALTRISAICGGDSCALIDSKTLERPYGWVFFYQSRRYLETGDPSEALAGNAPLIVNRQTGQVIETGTAHSVHYYLTQYEAALGFSAA